MTAFLLALWMLISCPICAEAASAEDIFPSGIPADAIGKEIEAFAAEQEASTAGMAVSVFSRSSVIYQNYFGHSNVEAGTAVAQDTVFEWGSATKLLVWVSIMQLWEQGKLDLHGDIRQYLPEDFLRNISFDAPVTMLNLMNHDAGFEDTLVGMSTHREERIRSLEDYLADIQPQQVFAPGEVTVYSNWGVALAGFIVERISGMPFYSYVHENIFAPLGMAHSALNADLSDNLWVRQQRQKLECYTADGKLIPDCMIYITMYPAGMCTSTLEDFTVFAQALLDRESPLFRDEATYDTFLEPSAYYGNTDIPLNHHGLWALGMYGVPVIGHGGNTAGCSAYLLLDVENGIGMTVMTNQSGEQIFNREMPELVFGSYDGEPLDFSGYTMNARTVWSGPLKLQKLLSIIHITPQTTAGAVSVLSEENGIQKLTAPYGDYLVMSVPQLIGQLLPALLWVLALLFCLLNLILRGIGSVIHKLRHRMPGKRIRKWTVVACVLQILPLIPVISAVMTFYSWKQWPLWLYDLVFGSFLVWPVVYGGLILWGVRNMIRHKRADIYSVAVIASLVVSVINILYWELGAFWRL